MSSDMRENDRPNYKRTKVIEVETNTHRDIEVRRQSTSQDLSSCPTEPTEAGAAVEIALWEGR
jgi:hypothetical protein